MVTGTVLAFDRVARVIAFENRSVWTLGQAEMPEGIEAGTRVTIDVTGAGDGGVGQVDTVLIAG